MRTHKGYLQKKFHITTFVGIKFLNSQDDCVREYQRWVTLPISVHSTKIYPQTENKIMKTKPKPSAVISPIILLIRICWRKKKPSSGNTCVIWR